MTVGKGEKPAARLGAPRGIDEYGSEMPSEAYALVDEVVAVAVHHSYIVYAQCFEIGFESLCARLVHLHGRYFRCSACHVEDVDAEPGREVGCSHPFGHKRAVPRSKKVGGGLLARKEGGEAEVRCRGQRVGEFLAEFAAALYLSDGVGVVYAVVAPLSVLQSERGRVVGGVAFNPPVV